MFNLKYFRNGLLNRNSYVLHIYYSTKDYRSYKLSKLLNIKENKARLMCLKHPVINKLDDVQIGSLMESLDEIGFSKDVLVDKPMLFSILPITLKYRYTVLEECGFENVTPEHIINYLPIVKQKVIGNLKKNGLIPDYFNIENRLASYMTQWPTSLTSLVYGDLDEITLYNLRLKIIERYLELVLDLSSDQFYRGIKTYPTIKHRPLQIINETIHILQSVVMIPNEKIKNNLYLVHVDPDNLKKIIYKFRSIGGMDIKEVLRIHPKLATKNYNTLVEIREVLKEYQISNDAQIRCFDIYTLSPKTIKDRLEKAKSIPEFNTFFSHPRFLKMIHYKNTAMKRIMNLYTNNKKCLSLNILSGSSAHYETFEKAPGDRLGKGKDLLFCISESLNKTYSERQIRNKLKRHPFWINIPLVQVKFVYHKLSVNFTNTDIYDNCPILLYPWSKIKETLNMLDAKNKCNLYFHESLDEGKLSKSQKLSLVLYLLEKKHYFTGNGVWTEEKNKTINDITDKIFVTPNIVELKN